MELDKPHKLPEGETLYHLCAREAINELERVPSDLKRIARISKEYGVLSSQTAYVAVQKLKHKITNAQEVVVPISVISHAAPSSTTQIY